MSVPAEVTHQEEGHTGFLHLPSAVLALIFLARRIQLFLSLVDRKVEFDVLTLIVLHFGIFFYFLFFGEEKSQLTHGATGSLERLLLSLHAGI